MPRITKKELQEKLDLMIYDNIRLSRENIFLEEKVSWYEKCTPGGYLSSMNIAMERISEALAETIKNIRR